MAAEEISGSCAQPQGTEPAFAGLLNAVPDAVLVTAGDGRILLANRQAELLFGYSREELLGQPVELLLPARFRGSHQQHRDVYASAPRVRPMGAGLELFALHKDGGEIPVEISLSPATVRGEPVVISTIRDITERKRAEAERSALLAQLQAIQTVTDAALAHLGMADLLSELLRRVRDVLGVDTVAILMLDEAGENLVARAALGLEEEVEQQVRVPVGRGFAGRVAAQRQAIIIADTGQAEIFNPILRARGVRSLLGVPLLVEGRMLGVLHVGTVQPRQFTGDEAALLQRVADRAALAIDRARLYQQAQDAIRIRNEFLSAISHDLGNPVAAIRMESRLLREGAAVQQRNRELVEALVQIEANAARMWKQVEELLDLARLQVGRALELQWRAIDLGAMLRELIAEQQATADKHQFRLELETTELSGEWDATRLERVFTNILANAVKYSPEGGEIVVRLAQEPDANRPGGWAVVQVRDHGIGIPAEDLPHIFERFHRARNVRGRFAGTGIGLAGAREIVALHGGELLVESEEGVGTTVTVRLPRDEEAV